MKIPRAPHSWSLTPRQAVAVQKRLAGRVRQTPLRRLPRLVAGTDCAFSRDGSECVASAVLYDLEAGSVVEQHEVWAPLRFPYVPGLLSFREAPTILKALRRLRARPDALLVDGQGLAHPRRFGIACHLGVICELPTVGVAKSRLVGEHREPGRRRGSRAPLLDGDETLGSVLRTRDGVKPVYVSVGHRIDLPSAVALVLRCGAGRRLPEPTRLADRAVAAAKRSRYDGAPAKEG